VTTNLMNPETAERAEGNKFFSFLFIVIFTTNNIYHIYLLWSWHEVAKWPSICLSRV